MEGHLEQIACILAMKEVTNAGHKEDMMLQNHLLLKSVGCLGIDSL